MDKNTEQIECSLSQIKFKSDENNFLIGKFIDKQGNHIICLGDIINPQHGMDYILSGTHSDHPKFGEQFKFHSYESILPIDSNGIFKYLTKICRWVGPKTGNMLIDTYQDRTLKMLKYHPEEVVKKISGITLERAKEIQKSLVENEMNEKVMIRLEALLDVPGMWKSVAGDLIKAYKDKAADIVEFNPYILTNFRGIGFPLADQVAMKNGVARTDIERKKAAALHCLKENMQTNGSVWVVREQLLEAIKGLIQVPKLKQGLDALEEEGVVVFDGIGYSLFKPSDDELYISVKIVDLVLREGYL